MRKDEQEMKKRYSQEKVRKKIQGQREGEDTVSELKDLVQTG